MTTREQELEKALRAMVNANWLFEPEEANRAVRAARAVLSAPSSEQGERTETLPEEVWTEIHCFERAAMSVAHDLSGPRQQRELDEARADLESAILAYGRQQKGGR